MTIERQSLGLRGEDLACQELERRGYTVISRRFRTAFGELDIIARHQDYVVFVEVKARTDRSFGDAIEAVTSQKEQRLVAMATEYLWLNRLVESETPCRFDVVTVETSLDPPRLTVCEDAFRPGW